MKADRTGDPADQLRYRIGWRTAEKGEPRCDGCEFAEVRQSGSGGAARVRCLLAGVATKPNATCDKPARMVQDKQCRDQSNWRMAAPGEADCATCEHYGIDVGNVLTCFAMDFPTSERHLCDHHQLANHLTLVNVLTRGGAPVKAPPGWDRSCADCAHHSPHDEPDTVWCNLHNRTSPTGWEYRCGEHTPIKEEPDMTEKTSNLPAIAEADGPQMPAPISPEVADALKMVGRVEMASFFATVAERAIAETYIKIKESNAWKGMPYRNAQGEPATVATIDEFCQHFLKKSYRRCQELVNNLHLLGPNLYEQAEAIGLGQRDYNALKALPADDQQIVKQAIEAEDRSRVIDLLQEMAVKHGKEKEAADRRQADLARQLAQAQADAASREDDLLADLAAKDKRISKKDERINELEDKLEHKAASSPVDLEAATRNAYARDLADQADSLAAGIDTSLRARCKAVLESHGDPAQREHGRLLVAQALGRVGSLLRILSIDFDVSPAEEARQAFDHGMDGEDAEIWRMTHATLARQGQGQE